MTEGWIKLHRRFLKWEWFELSEMIKLFIYFLLKANFENKNWKGIEVKRGQFITGRKQLSKDLQMSEQMIRTCIGRLKSTNEITIQSTNKYSIITVLNYDSYQLLNSDHQPAKQPATQPTSNQQATTTKKDKNIKKEDTANFYELEKQKVKGIYKDKYIAFIDFLYGKNDMGKSLDAILKLEEQVTFKNFCTLMEKIRNINNENGSKKVQLSEMIMAMHNKPKYIKGNKSLYLTLNSWINRER